MTPWNKIYKRYKETGEIYSTIGAPLNPAFLDFFEHSNFPLKRVLDIGCGTGAYLKYLYEKGFEVEGIDSSETVVAMSKELLGDRGKIILADMYSYEFLKNSYGLILSIATMSHGRKRQIKDLVQKIYDALLHRGRVFLTLIETWKREETVGNIKFLGDGEFILLEGLEKGILHNFYTREEIEQLFSQFKNLTIQNDLTSNTAEKWIVIAER